MALAPHLSAAAQPRPAIRLTLARRRGQRPWAKYFSKFIEAYKKHGIPMWGVTVQNEPEAAVGWEACLYNASFMASFVRDHLGPVLEQEQPGTKILGFDHNKDHMVTWAEELYKDPKAKQYFHGVGVPAGIPSTLSDDTAPCLLELRPLLRPPERRPSILEACGGHRSPPRAAPKLRMFRFQPPGLSRRSG